MQIQGIGSTRSINESKAKSKENARKQSGSNRDSRASGDSVLNLAGCVIGSTESINSEKRIQKKLSSSQINEQTSFIQASKSSYNKFPKYEAQTSYDLSFFLQQNVNQSMLISPQLSLALFQFLSSCK